MSYRTEGTCLAAWVAMLALSLTAHHGCGGDDETDRSGCSDDEVKCDGACVDTLTDPLHCGDCGQACQADRPCVAGVCECPAGYTACPDGCVILLSDPANCGICGNLCAEFMECVNGNCQCGGGQTLCGEACADTETDKLHCGGCDQPCVPAQECITGGCRCPDGKELCGSECVDTNSNASFCGDCSTKCDPGEYCNVGSCETISSCDQVPVDGYEPNDTCETAWPLPEAPEVAQADAPVTVGDATPHHTDGSVDTDWYTVYAHEATHICVPFSPQCSFYFDIGFAPPAGADHTVYEMCVSTGDCGAFDSEFCTTAMHWDDQAKRYGMVLSWQGKCGSSDSWTFYVKIARNGGQESCSQYALDYKLFFLDGECS